jgi:hypothetical protein
VSFSLCSTFYHVPSELLIRLSPLRYVLRLTIQSSITVCWHLPTERVNCTVQCCVAVRTEQELVGGTERGLVRIRVDSLLQVMPLNGARTGGPVGVCPCPVGLFETLSGDCV